MEDLIVKISDKCNFACEFCSSNNIATNHNDLDINILKDYLLNHEVGSLIVNGGDPLCTDPEYYWELLEFIRSNNLKTYISFTTNLLDFWRHPDKWTPLFNESGIGICTSFQYGGKRKLATGEVFTEAMFREVYALFEERTGKKLKFIAVIDDDNEDTVIETVQLAKSLGTTCKINPCLRSGRASSEYSYAKMFERYLDIIEAGLSEYEENNQLVRDAWHGKFTLCAYAPNCGTIMCMSPDGSVTRCGSISDDIMQGGIPDYFLLKSDKVPFNLTVLGTVCFTCEFHNICNSCHKRVMDIRDGGYEAEHCVDMHAQLERAKKILGEQC